MAEGITLQLTAWGGEKQVGGIEAFEVDNGDGDTGPAIRGPKMGGRL